MNQRGFATLEVILMVMVIGILASIAIPRFGNVTAEANTAKIRADLSTIDTAISVYYMENGSYPTGTAISILNDYLKGASDIKPPLKGQCYMGSTTPTGIPAKVYTIQQPTSGTNDEPRAICGTGNTAEKFYKGTTD